MKKKSGFTLIELLVILAFIGIVVVMASSISLKNKNRWDLRGASREIASTYYEMKQRASKENLPFRISFSGNSLSTWSCVETGGVRSWQKIKDIPIGTIDKVFIHEGAKYPDIAIDSRGMIYTTSDNTPIDLTLASIQIIELRSPLQGSDFGDKSLISFYPIGGIHVESVLAKQF